MKPGSKGSFGRLLASRTGASSVLVLLVLLVLVFLSVLAFVSTGSNLRLSRKHAESVRSWYRMDAEGERMAAKALRTVRGAAEQSAAWLDGNLFLDAGQDVLPEETAAQWRTVWVALATEAERTAFREERFGTVHAALAAQSLRKAFPHDADVSVTAGFPFVAAGTDDGTDEAAGTTEAPAAGADGAVAGPVMRLRADDPQGEATGHLEVVLQVLPAQRAGEGGHVRILSWRMVQAPFEYRNEIELWEGIVE